MWYGREKLVRSEVMGGMKGRSRSSWHSRQNLRRKKYKSKIWEGGRPPLPEKANLKIPELSSSLGAGFQNLGSTQGLQIAVWSTPRRYGKYSIEW